MKKQKRTRIILLAVAVLTVVLAVMGITMLRAVKGDDLFYMDSRKGYFYARAYRWICLAAGLLVLFWIAFVFRKRKEILSKLPRVELNQKKSAIAEKKAAELQTARPQPAAQNEKVFCSGCGKQISSDINFCPFCGAIVGEKKQ